MSEPVATHETYAAQVPEAVRPRLAQIQATIEALLPKAQRCIGYRMPAYREGRIFIYVGVFKKHIGIYPPVTQDQALVNELAPYRGDKGNLTFVHSLPLPLDLIGRVAVALHRQYAASAPQRPGHKSDAKADAVATLAAQAQLGPKSAQMLVAAGITSMAALRRLGSVAAYAKVKQQEPRATLNLLWGLEAALQSLPWQTVAREHRTSLLLALDELQSRQRGT